MQQDYKWQGCSSTGRLREWIVGGAPLARMEVEEGKSVLVRRVDAVEVVRWLRERFDLKMDEVFDFSGLATVLPEPIFGELLETTLTQGAVIDYVDSLDPEKRSQLVRRIHAHGHVSPYVTEDEPEDEGENIP